METTSYIALSSQGVLSREMDSIAHNLANMNTTGFKSERNMFVNYVQRSRSADFIGDQKLSFVRDLATFTDTSEGAIEQTGNPLDLAIHGDGYFVVQTPGGDRYTRDGSFRLDSGGQLVTQDGQPVLSNAGAPIFFTPEDTSITISADGSVSTENGQLAKLRIVNFDNTQVLENIGGGLYSSAQQPTDNLNPQIVQGALEGSNVKAILEMTRMIQVNRDYTQAQKLLEGEDERIRKMINALPLLS